ncbi:RNA-directed DNA polymerase, eukaryota [Tanacetum coccineum]
MEVKFLWGNYFFDHIISEASGNSGGILCAWDTNFFKKDHHTISDNFIALYGTWIPNNQKLLIISVYAPQSVSSKRMLWSYLESLITSWNGESSIVGDFNEVRCIKERWGFSFTWAHPSATKMSKLDRFLMSNGLLSAFPLILAICLDHHLSDHRLILLKEVFSDFGHTPFRFYHSWLELPGFDDLVSKSWNSFTLDDSNGMIRFKKKLQMLKKEIRAWTLDFKRHQVGLSKDLKSKLCDIDKVLDQGGVTDDILLSRLEVLKQLHDVQSSNNRDIMQKEKIRGQLEGDENSNTFMLSLTKNAPSSVKAVKWFFDHGDFAIGCNSSFVALIPKVLDPKVVSDYRPINVQTAFLPNRQILDGPFIINEILARCKLKKQQAMIFKVDFAKAYDSVRWDYLDDVLISFGFGPKWRIQ